MSVSTNKIVVLKTNVVYDKCYAVIYLIYLFKLTLIDLRMKLIKYFSNMLYNSFHFQNIIL